MHELAGRRMKAYGRDIVGYAGIAAGTVPLGLLANARGRSRRRGFTLAVSAIPPMLATLHAARQETHSGATRGKRHYGLQVAGTSGDTVRFGRALLRNVVKIGTPWQIGHLVAVGAAFGGFARRDPLTVSAAVLTYPLVGAMITSVLTAEGRAIHDRVARTTVLSVR